MIKGTIILIRFKGGRRLILESPLSFDYVPAIMESRRRDVLYTVADGGVLTHAYVNGRAAGNNASGFLGL